MLNLTFSLYKIFEKATEYLASALLAPNPQFEHSLMSCNMEKKKKKTFPSNSKQKLFFLKFNLKISGCSVPPSLLSSPSSSDLAQPVVRLRVGNDGLNSYDGLVDLCLELPQLLHVQQAQDLSRFVQSGILSGVETFILYIQTNFPTVWCWVKKNAALTSSIKT